ncbi:MAG: chaperone modulator CbpM [Myxococcota bacterium]
MTFYSRAQVAKLLELDEGFVMSLEREEIIQADAPAESEGEFSERMLERARVARELVRELDVNLAGAAIIVRMREQMLEMRESFEKQLLEIRERFQQSD